MSPAPYLALVLALGAVCQLVAYRLRIPSILLLLVTGSGIVGMRRRVAEHGGELTAEEHDGTFTLVARVPAAVTARPARRRW